MQIRLTTLVFIGQLLAVLFGGADVVVITPEITVNLILPTYRSPDSTE